MSKLGYRPALDGLRAVAIAAVLLYHTAALLPGGHFGVDLFFVLSGFLITTLLLEEHARNGEISLRAFYRRRALRLLPALFALLAVFLAVATVAALAGGRSLAKDVFGVVAGVGYFSNVAMVGEPATRPMPEELRHLWSLAQEEQFYLLWPLVLVLLLRRSPRLMYGAVAAGVGLTALWQLQLYVGGAGWARMAFGPDSRILPILVGCLVALVLANPRGVFLRRARWLGPPSAACVLVLFLTLPDARWVFPGPLLLFSLACAGLIVAVLDERSPITRALSVSPVVYLGRISYSLYLWHFPLFFIVGLNDLSREHTLLPSLAAIAATFACAMASYHVVELPFLRRKHRVRESPRETRQVDVAARPAETGA